jgi:hypothetical protein
MVEQIVTIVLTYLNAANFYKSSLEVANALNMASLDIYKRLRGNMAQYRPGSPIASIEPGQTNVSADSIAELYQVLTFNGPGPLTISAGGGTVVDIVESVEVQYVDANGTFYPVNIVPDNQFLRMANNPVIPPTATKPLGRMDGLLEYEIRPSTYFRAKTRVLTLPTVCEFTFSDSGGQIPTINVITDLNWSEDKIDNLVYGTIAALGFNLQNGVLVQAGNAMNDKQI